MKKKKIFAILTAASLTLTVAGCGSSTPTSAATAADSTAAESKAENTAYSSSATDGHAILADGEDASYDNITVTKTGDSAGNDEADFYGGNAAVLAENGATLTISNADITTGGAHANAVFSYGEGTTVNISDSTIHTTGNNSGGIMTTGGAAMNAANLNVVTEGGSSAAIRSDRGGGTVKVSGGYYEANGSGSPAIYSTADITVEGAQLVSNAAQGIVVEGKNSVTLTDTDVTADNTVQNSDKSDTCQAVMLYQSMSGDADEGDSSFSMTGGSLTSKNGGMFYVTNTDADISLENVTLAYATDDLLRIEKAGWGTDGSNGGNVNFTAKNQKLQGKITVDDISTLNLYLNSGTSFEGAINTDGSAGDVYVEVADGATWTLTGDSWISSLTCGAGAVNLNGHKLYVNGQEYTDGTASQGSAVEAAERAETGTPDTPPDGQAPAGQAPSDNGQAPNGSGQNPPAKPEGSGSSAPDSGSAPGSGSAPKNSPTTENSAG